MDCIFCKIISGDIPSNKAYEDEYIYAFYDIEPQAPVHILVIPKEHIDSCDMITRDNSDIVKHIFEIIPEIAKMNNLSNGYRVVTNVGEYGCQSVKHMHFHILSGRQLDGQLG